MRRSYSRILRGTIGRLAAVASAVLAATALAAPAPAPLRAAQAAQTIPAVLDELRQSLFPHGTARVPVIRTKARIEIGSSVAGSVETVATLSPVALRETLELGGVRQVATLADGVAWFEDANGKVRRASGDEFASYRIAHALLFHTYLDGPPDGFTMELTDGALRFVPSGEGAPRTLELGRSADGLLLPVQWRQRQQGTEVTTTFEDWRDAGPMRFPHRSVQRSGDPRFDLVLVTTDVEFPSSLPPDEIAAPSRAPIRDADVLDAAQAEAIPLSRIGALAAVEATVNGEEGTLLLLDTGAGATVLSTALVRRLGLDVVGHVEARGAGGSEAAGFVRLRSLRLAGVELRDQTVVALPLEALRTALARPIDGILGYDFFSRFAVQIDYPRNTLSLFRAGSYEPPPGAVRMPLRLESNVPRVDGVLDDVHSGSFVIDLGNATALVLHHAFAARSGYLARAGTDTFPLSGIGGTGLMHPIRVDRLALGGFRFEGIDAVIPASGDGALSLDEAMGNVGAGLFVDRGVAFDYDAESLWVLPATARSASER